MLYVFPLLFQEPHPSEKSSQKWKATKRKIESLSFSHTQKSHIVSRIFTLLLFRYTYVIVSHLKSYSFSRSFRFINFHPCTSDDKFFKHPFYLTVCREKFILTDEHLCVCECVWMTYMETRDNQTKRAKIRTQAPKMKHFKILPTFYSLSPLLSTPSTY